MKCMRKGIYGKANNLRVLQESTQICLCIVFHTGFLSTLSDDEYKKRYLKLDQDQLHQFEYRR